jgi:hypothetical protein
VHAVVDFRQAPALGAPGAPQPGATAAAPPAPMGGAGAQPSQGAIQAALVPSTGGNVVYYRVE